MRILLITGEFPPMQGGVGDYTGEIARGLAARDGEVRVLTSTKAALQPASPFSVSADIPHWGWSMLGRTREVVRAFHPEIVHIQYQTGAYGMHPAINSLARYLRAREPNTRTVTTFHDLLPAYLFPKAGRVRDAVTFELARSSAAVIATSERDYARLRDLRLSSLALIPIGSNIPTTLPRGYDRAAWRAQLGVEPDEWLVCHFGFINDRKGVDTLVRALKQLEPPARAKLLLVGGQTGASDPSNAVTLERVRALIAELALENRVIWTGYVPPEIVTAHLRAADLCVLPFREGATYQHGTLMAALAHALAIVTTRLPSAAPLPDSPLPPLLDGENCLLVPPNDPAALAEAIRRALVSPELRARISRGACDLARHFTWDKIVEQHLELYAGLTGAD